MSSILLVCSHCSEKIGSLDVDSKVRAEELIEFLVKSRISIFCKHCQCEHEYIE
jgi:hypothetical protein